MPFNRGLSDPFIDLLREEATKPGWWRDVLQDETLLVGVRDEYLNVYWQGQALFTVTCVENKLQVTTHEKFLLDPDLNGQIRLEDSGFKIEGLRAKGFMSQLKAGTTLPKIKRAAQRFADSEKKGCHVIAKRNAMVVDFEVAFPTDADFPTQRNRVDLACFEESNGSVRLTFWEAKHFANPELRAQDGDAPVVHQIERYTAWITAHRTELEKSYRRVAQNLAEFEKMGWKRTLPVSVKAVAANMPLSLDDVPPVSLLIFGFDQDQRDGQVWARHRKKQEAKIGRIVCIGNATSIRLPARTTDGPVESPISDAEPQP